MVHWRKLIAASLTTLGLTFNANAAILAKIDLNDQEMQVFVDGKLRHTWSIASGRRGYETPTGSYRPQRLEREWYSRQYDDAPMPYSVFFSGGYAIHGGYGRMGRPASHGCVRLNTTNAARFYALVAEHGPRHTRIVIDE
ncbi:MAG: L,D-transpeptidase [Hyphomicrobiaceae bacterium]|nr:L,D-transpeptidase [Hyphomicrobiaceae bacterium]